MTLQAQEPGAALERQLWLQSRQTAWIGRIGLAKMQNLEQHLSSGRLPAIVAASLAILLCDLNGPAGAQIVVFQKIQ